MIAWYAGHDASSPRRIIRKRRQTEADDGGEDQRGGRADWLDGGAARRQPGAIACQAGDPTEAFLQHRPQRFRGPLFDRIVADLNGEHIELLSIFAHGYVLKDAQNVLHGGYGVQFGKDDILVQNAETLFRRFNGKCPSNTVGIELVGCEVAAQSKVKQGKSVEVGDGIDLCKRIALGASTWVRASPSAQIFATVGEFSRIVADPANPTGRGSQTGMVVDPGVWEGNIWVISKDGRH